MSKKAGRTRKRDANKLRRKNSNLTLIQCLHCGSPGAWKQYCIGKTIIDQNFVYSLEWGKKRSALANNFGTPCPLKKEWKYRSAGSHLCASATPASIAVRLPLLLQDLCASLHPAVHCAPECNFSSDSFACALWCTSLRRSLSIYPSPLCFGARRYPGALCGAGAYRRCKRRRPLLRCTGVHRCPSAHWLNQLGLPAHAQLFNFVLTLSQQLRASPIAWAPLKQWNLLARAWKEVYMIKILVCICYSLIFVQKCCALKKSIVIEIYGAFNFYQICVTLNLIIVEPRLSESPTSTTYCTDAYVVQQNSN